MTFIDLRIVTGHDNNPRLIVDCRHPGALLPVSMTPEEFAQTCEQDGTDLTPIILGGEVFDRSQPFCIVQDEDIIIPF